MRRLAMGMAIFSLAAVAVSWAAADDKDIAREITTRLKQEQDAGNLWGFDINLQVGQGTVVLKGHVASQEQQQLALETAREVSGVKKVVDQLQIKTNAPADDDAVAAAIAESLAELKASGQMKDFRIGVGVTDGQADLNGSVVSEEHKQLALEAARTTTGVRQVVDNLRVAAAVEPVEALVQAEADETAAPTASVSSPSVPRPEPQPLKVAGGEPRRARVGQAGAVPVLTPAAIPSSAEPVGTGRVAAGKPQAAPVENALYRQEPKPNAAADQQIGARLMQQLKEAKEEGQLRGFGIGVHVQDARVRLTGRVSSLEQQQLALDVARRIEGVREVIDQLTIGEPAAASNVTSTTANTTPIATSTVSSTGSSSAEDLRALSLDIAQSLGQQLQAQEARGLLNGCDFDVKVERATIRLTGTVASAEQQRLVLQLARQIPGVRTVEADLRVAAPGQPAQLAATPVSLHGPAAPGPAYPMGELGAPAYVPYQGGAMPSAEMMVDQTPRPLGPARAVARAGAAVVAAPFAALHHGGQHLGGHHMGGGAVMGEGYAAGASPAYLPGGVVPARYDHPNLPGYAWPSYAAYPNYAAVTYPKQYSPTAWPYIGPFYPYPQVPLGWRKVTLKWDDGWWQLNFKSK